MSVNIGITGLPRSGRTTIFNALTRGAAATHVAEASHIGIAKVPEPRLKTLADLLRYQKTVPVEAKYVDVAATVRGGGKDKGGSGELLAQLSTVDAVMNVVRAFTDASIPHPTGSLDVKRDIAAMNMELAFSDLIIIERRMEKIELSLKGAKAPERQLLLQEKDILLKFKAELEKDIPIREMPLSPAEARGIPNYQFLTAKPLLIVANIDEEQLAKAAATEAELKATYSRGKSRAITLCGKLEMELAQLDEKEARELRDGYGLKEAGLDRVIKVSYELLGLVSFFTIVSNEVRAWSVPTGTSAVKAASKIHSDMERGFIRAEVIHCDELARCGSLAEARKKGVLRLEGKDYAVRDGDVITFLFNV
ncbi:MAG: redox-regulated ATPase YchF [Dehalococcoidales bacterium]|nr:redox-regulated ATPase YchF [Dehalococcoidales bacterium]